jgi:hypothetical protein
VRLTASAQSSTKARRVALLEHPQPPQLSGVSSDKGWVEGSIHPSCFARSAPQCRFLNQSFIRADAVGPCCPQAAVTEAGLNGSDSG